MFVNILIQYSFTNIRILVCLKSHPSIFWFPFSSLSHPPLGTSCSNNEDLFFYNFVVTNVFLSIFIYKAYNIALQNTILVCFRKISKHFLISIFFPMGRGDTPSLPPPPPPHSPLRASNKGFALFMTIHAPPPLPPNPGSATANVIYFCIPKTY